MQLKHYIQYVSHFRKKTRILLLKALVISHLHYPLVLLNETKKLTQLAKIDLGKKGCFKKKLITSQILKILPKNIRYFLKFISVGGSNSEMEYYPLSQMKTNNSRYQKSGASEQIVLYWNLARESCAESSSIVSLIK